MEAIIESRRLRIYFSSTDKMEHTLLSEYLVRLAHDKGLAGATVMKGIIGYGSSSVIHSYKFWEISEKVPVVVEIVDSNEKVMGFYLQIKPQLEAMRYGCMVTIENVDLLLYKSGNPRNL
jgi:uncharacterized protein